MLQGVHSECVVNSFKFLRLQKVKGNTCYCLCTHNCCAVSQGNQNLSHFLATEGHTTTKRFSLIYLYSPNPAQEMADMGDHAVDLPIRMRIGAQSL